MDLKPINPTDKYPRCNYENSDNAFLKGLHGTLDWGRFNWYGWSYLREFLKSHGCDTSQMIFSNDGDVICEEHCKAIADCIEKNSHELSTEDKEWLDGKIIYFRECGGFEQH